MTDYIKLLQASIERERDKKLIRALKTENELLRAQLARRTEPRTLEVPALLRPQI
jgi:hypothetical protein